MGVIKPPAGQFLIPNPANAWARHGFVGAWLLNDTGPRTRDWSGYGNHGTWDNSDGGMSYIVGEHGRAFTHAGNATNDRIDLGSCPSTSPLSLSSGTAYTIVWRAQLNSDPLTNAAPRLIDKSNSGNGANGWALMRISTHDGYELRVDSDTIGPNSPPITRDVMQNWALRIDGAWTDLGSFDYFLEGVKTAAAGGAAPSAPPTTTTNIAIANWNHSTDRQWDGPIDYIYIYARALSDAEIRYLQLVDPYVAFRPEAPASVFAPAAAATSQPVFLYHHRHHNRAA